MKSKFSDFDSSRSLTREQMKKVTGGISFGGTRCNFYCCPSNCSGNPFFIVVLNPLNDPTCYTNEDCLSLPSYPMSSINPCDEGDYVAALCKG